MPDVAISFKSLGLSVFWRGLRTSDIGHWFAMTGKLNSATNADFSKC